MTLRSSKFSEEKMIMQCLLYVCLWHMKMKHHQGLQVMNLATGEKKSNEFILTYRCCYQHNKKKMKSKGANSIVKANKRLGFTSSSHVFLWAEDGGTQTCPFSREFSIALSRALDKSCLTRWFLAFQPKVEGDSEPVTSTT